MSGDLLRIRDAYYCGFYKDAQSRLHVLAGEDLNLDSLTMSEIELLDLRCTAAQSIEAIKALAPALPPSSSAVAHCAIVLASESSEADRLKSWEFLRSLDLSTVRDSFVQSLTSLCLGLTTLDGKLPESSQQMGSVNSVIADILSTKSPEANVLEFILLMAADRFDLAHQVYSRIMSSADDSVLPQLVQVWSTMLKGNFSEAFLTVGDIEALLEVEPENTSATFDQIRGVCKLNLGQYEEAIGFLTKAAKATDYQRTDVLINLISAHQNAGHVQEAQELTTKLKVVTPSSHPYMSKLNSLNEIASKYTA